jgi:HK97 family phage major capsid protein
VPMSVFQMEKRTITSNNVSPDFGGSHLGNQFIDVLRAKLITRRLGARVLSGLTGDVEIPKQSAAAGTSWLLEDSELGDSDASFQKITLEPKHCGAMTEFSRNILLQSSPDIEQLIRMDFAAVLANALDVAALNGSGSTQPTGILNLSGLATVNGPVSWTKVLEMIETLEEANTEGTGWAMTPAMKRLLRSTAKVSSTDSVMIMESPNELAGYRAETSTNVPTTAGSPSTGDALIFGDWSDLLIGTWDSFSVLVNPYESSAYKRGNTKVRGLMTVDIAARHTESFVAMVSHDAG